MKRISVLAIAGIFVFCSASHSFAGNGIDECGFGKKIGSSGTVIALVNIFLSLYTYSSATTSGTSDCSGLASNDELRYRYVASSYKLLQYEAAEGKGDHLDGLAVLMGCSAEPFNQMVQANYGDLFVDNDSIIGLLDEEDLLLAVHQASERFVNSLKSKITSDSTLNQNCYQS